MKLMRIISATLGWIATAVILLCLLGIGIHYSGLFLLLAIFLILPLRIVQDLRDKIKLKKWLACVLAVVLFFTGICLSPHSEDEPNTHSGNNTSQTTTTSRPTAQSTSTTSSALTTTTTQTNTTKTTATTSGSSTIEAVAPTVTSTTNNSKISTTTKTTTTAKVSTTTKATTTTKKTTTKTTTTTKAVYTYVLNTNTRKFHYMSCRYVKDIHPENYAESTDPRETIISNGYTPCGSCKP